MYSEYDVIVVGGGHAGCEAVLASARMGANSLLITMSIESIGLMSCNPAIGGIGKGQIVREIDALGGEMARAADDTGIMFRRLNTSKGLAVVSSRVQCDRKAYNLRMMEAVLNQKNIEVFQGVTVKLLVRSNRVFGVETDSGDRFYGGTVVLTTGTFLNGLMHFGLRQKKGGRFGEQAVYGITEELQSLGFITGRLKTGTPPRLKRDSIDFSSLERQDGDNPPLPLSFSSQLIQREQVPCYITYTNEHTHRIIRANLDKSPLYSGVIVGIGPRYCPSIEDKVTKFPGRSRHQVFLEPEGVDSEEVYPNGLSSSLPEEVQLEFLRSIRGMEGVVITRPGYAVEYDFVNPVQLKPTLETKLIANLYLAGQINGTSGYEEAGAQGLIAGINATLKVKSGQEFILGRDEAYIGVLIDDLVTKGVTEPYRMFTSRVEFRLLLREDNADLRLREKGYKLGLVNEGDYRRLLLRKESLEMELSRLSETILYPTQKTLDLLKKLNTEPIKKPTSLKELIRRPEVSYTALAGCFWDDILNDGLAEQIEAEIRFEGYIKRQMEDVRRFRQSENEIIPQDIDYSGISGLSREIKEKLSIVKPTSIGQAKRIPGMTPAAISLLMYAMRARAAKRAQK